MNASPADPLNEDTSVLALFDALIEEGESASNYFDSSSSDDDDDDDDDDGENDSDDLYLMEDDERRLHRLMRALPFFGRLFPDDDSDTTPTDSELSCANTSSLEPPWSDEDDMEELDEELREMYGYDIADWSNSESSDSDSAMSEEGEEDGRVGRISSLHNGEVGEGDKAKETSRRSGASAKDRVRKTEGPSGSQSKRACDSGSSASRSGTHSQPTRCQPSRKAKKVAAAIGDASEENTSSTGAEMKIRDSSSAAGSSQPKPKKDGGSKNSKRCQPKRKVKSTSACPSAAIGCDNSVVEAVNSEPLASSSSSSLVKPKKSGSGSRAIANGNSETTSSGSGPSRRWTRKRNRRQQEANGTAADNYQQYRAEDFLKAKSPTSFYAKKRDPP